MPIFDNYFFPHPVQNLHFAFGHLMAFSRLVTSTKRECFPPSPFEEGVFSSSSFLSKKYNLPSRFRFFQIRHFTQKQFPHFPNCPPETHIDHFLDLNVNQKHLISVIYN